jgi:hypothetical protein
MLVALGLFADRMSNPAITACAGFIAAVHITTRLLLRAASSHASVARRERI